MGDDRDVIKKSLGTGLAEVPQGIVDEFQDHGIAKIAVQGTKLDPGQPAICRALKSSWPFASRALADSTLERSIGERLNDEVQMTNDETNRTKLWTNVKSPMGNSSFVRRHCQMASAPDSPVRIRITSANS